MSGPCRGTLPTMEPERGLYPVTFTPRKRIALLHAIKSGQTVRAACARANISVPTYYRHLNEDLTLQEAVNRARGEAEARLVEAITNGAHSGETVTTSGGQVTVKPGDWRAAAWLLEHHPHTRERYASINKTQLGGDPDNPTPVLVEVEGGGMPPAERFGAVIAVLQRAGVLPGEAILLPSPPEPEGGISVAQDPPGRP